VEEQEHGLRPTEGWDLSLELDITHIRVDRISDENATKDRQLSQLVVGISDALFDLGMLSSGQPPTPKVSSGGLASG
jgi:hypothetical protein